MRTNVPYSGYYNRPPRDEDTLLTHVGPGTPCGEYLRRYWHPFMLSSELKDLPVRGAPARRGPRGVPRRSGRIGLLHRHCAHRGTSLEFGIPQERGIRCCYHGWHFDIDGTILDTPGRAADEPHQEQFRAGRLPGDRDARAALRLHGAAGSDAGIPGLRQLRLARGQPARRVQHAPAVQLAADHRERRRSDPQRVPARHRERPAVLARRSRCCRCSTSPRRRWAICRWRRARWATSCSSARAT